MILETRKQVKALQDPRLTSLAIPTWVESIYREQGVNPYRPLQLVNRSLTTHLAYPRLLKNRKRNMNLNRR